MFEDIEVCFRFCISVTRVLRFFMDTTPNRVILRRRGVHINAEIILQIFLFLLDNSDN